MPRVNASTNRLRLLKYLVISASILAATAILAVALVHSGEDKPSSQNRTSIVEHEKPSTACSLLTLTDAKQILGSDAKRTNNGAPPDTISETAEVTACSYIAGSAAPGETSKSAVLIVRLARSQKGADYSKSMFDAEHTVGKQLLEGIGDAAFWEDQLAYLNILKGDTWYIIGNAKDTQHGQGDLNTSLAIYDQIRERL